MSNINLELKEYIKSSDKSKQEKAKYWEIAIGLQDVDGLKPSKYLLETAKEHIEGNIDINEVTKRINSYYEQVLENSENEEEADKVASRIIEILNDDSFSFSIKELLSIHKRLFQDIYDHAGKYRKYNFTKKEWILSNDTVIYSSYENIEDTLKYDVKEEKNFSYKNLNIDDTIKHLSKFVSDIWQVHPFCEGNTRAIAVFIIKYLRTFGFDVNNEPFFKNSWYFRNALVRANYKNYDKNIFADFSFLEKFFYNLLTSSNYELKNRYMHIEYNLISLEEEAIISIIQEDSNVNQEDIANRINKSLRTVKNYMSSMQKKGLIERKNGKRNSIWIIR